jgi:stress response protein SCP2
VLLQVMEHFKFRDENAGTMRYFFPKGNVAKMKAIKDDRASIPTDQSKKIVTICQNALKAKYSSLDALGNVYIDPALKNVLVPFSMRSASKALKTVSRGSKFDLGDKGTVRFFIWWKDKGHDRVDIDLSAMFLKDDYSIGAQIAYYDLRGGNAGMGCHSGDITSAPNGASEFIDININKALAKGARFIVMVINSYTQQKYCDLPECFAGFMMREQVQSGEIYDARTVENKFDVTSDTRTVVPLIIDLKERKVIWTDMQLSSSRMYNNAKSHSSGISAIAKAMNEMHKPNLHELFTLHAKSRGTIVKKKEDAETIFSLTEGTTPFDHEEIISQYI